MGKARQLEEATKAQVRGGTVFLIVFSVHSIHHRSFFLHRPPLFR